MESDDEDAIVDWRGVLLLGWAEDDDDDEA